MLQEISEGFFGKNLEMFEEDAGRISAETHTHFSEITLCGTSGGIRSEISGEIGVAVGVSVEILRIISKVTLV